MSLAPSNDDGSWRGYHMDLKVNRVKIHSEQPTSYDIQIMIVHYEFEY